MSRTNKKLSASNKKELLQILKHRFEKNIERHKSIEWDSVQARLEANDEKLWSINEMERTGGEPDVVGYDKKTGEYSFTIVRRKAQADGEASVTTVKDGNQEKNIGLKILQ